SISSDVIDEGHMGEEEENGEQKGIKDSEDRENEQEPQETGEDGDDNGERFLRRPRRHLDGRSIGRFWGHKKKPPSRLSNIFFSSCLQEFSHQFARTGKAGSSLKSRGRPVLLS